MKILIIGGGNMGKTYARSLLRAKLTNQQDLMLLERNAEKAAMLKSEEIGTVFVDPSKCLDVADLIILAVKPQDSEALFERLRPQVHPQQVYLSIMAGVKIETIQSMLGAEKVIRAMPNLPAQLGMGMTTYTASPQVTRIELVLVQNLLNTTGKTIYADDEDAIDATTAISGSGPAYVFYFMESMILAALKMGFSRSEAELLVAQTFKGAIELYNNNDISCQEWIARVASKGGTTERALQTFENYKLDSIIEQGAQAAFIRAVELSKKKLTIN